jgi:cupin 2 domain-containing protein
MDNDIDSESASISSGRFRHYKGNEYSVVGVARHSETLEELVVYRQEYGERGLWVRPEQMFLETVMVGGQEVPRFQRLDSEHESDSANVTNLVADLPNQLPQELVQTLLNATDVRIERIVSRGHTSPEGFWYDQDQHEWVIVLKGEAKVRFEAENDPVDLKSGDFVNIPAHKKHRVEWTTPNEPTVWLAVHYGDQGKKPRSTPSPPV